MTDHDIVVMNRLILAEFGWYRQTAAFGLLFPPLFTEELYIALCAILLCPCNIKIPHTYFTKQILHLDHNYYDIIENSGSIVSVEDDRSQTCKFINDWQFHSSGLYVSRT